METTPYAGPRQRRRSGRALAGEPPVRYRTDGRDIGTHHEGIALAMIGHEPYPCASQKVYIDTTSNTPQEPACFGIVCPLHGRCARYEAVNLSQADPHTLGTCRTGQSYPLFLEIERREAG